MNRMRLKLDEDNLEVNGLAVMCHPLGENAYWLRNENFVVVFNPGVLAEEVIIFYGNGFTQEHYNQHHAGAYSIEDIVNALKEKRK